MLWALPKLDWVSIQRTWKRVAGALVCLHDAIGKNCDNTLPVKQAELEQILQAASDAKPSPPLVKRYRNKVLSVLVNQIRDENGQPFGVVSLLRDITEQAAIEGMAQMTPLKAITDPVERSIPPATITMAAPTA